MIINTMNETIGGIRVSIPANSFGVIKNIINLKVEPTISDASVAGKFALFQNKPKVNGANAPAKTMSNAKIKYTPGRGIVDPNISQLA